jgi:2-polyprenyl-3-methyl-5-hydroxy-6-metoxy-1,4-benzoquinol methylase
VENINAGELGRTYWNQQWQIRGVQKNIYPRTYEYILSQIKGTDRAIDLGCGTGSFVREFREVFPVQQFDKHTIWGMDVSDYAIKKTTDEVLEFYGIVGEFPYDMPIYLWRTFDVVIATELLEHITEDDVAACAIAMLCKDAESIAMISVPDNTLPPQSEAEHQRTYTLEQLDELFGKYFDSVSIVRIEQEQKLLAICSRRNGYAPETVTGKLA